MSTPYQLTFTLKQHTPIIHFQHDQAGATLRATEVKPKLDRFLIKIFNDSNTDFATWLINGQEKALDYKMSFVDNTEWSEKKVVNRIKLITDPVHSSVMSKDIKLSIFCLNASLRAQLDKYLEEFFVLHNFGTRQNKGWGSFTLDKTDYASFERILKNSKRPSFKRTTVQTVFPIKGDWEQQIKIDNQRLKSGLNHSSFRQVLNNNNGYEKSGLFEYFNAKDRGWEKRFIKKEISSSKFHYKLSRKTPDTNSANQDYITEFVFIRALLGLAEHYEFQIDYNGQVDKNKKYKVKIDGGKIERFKSPLTYKVFKDNIYVILEEIQEAIFNASFDFSLGTRSRSMGGKERDDNNFINLKPIRTPNKSEFDLENFINTCANKLNYMGYVHVTRG